MSLSQRVKPLRLACVGLGRMGCIRSEAIATHPKAQLAWVVDLDEGRRSEFSARFAAKGSSNAADALSDESVDAVWIAAPTDAHEDLIKEALANGKAVGVEKPVCNSPVAAASCYDAAESAGLPLFCSFQRRFDPTYQDVATHVASGAIGTVKKIHAVFRDHPCPDLDFLKRGGDPFHDLLVHDIDYILSEIMKVKAADELPSRILGSGTSFMPELKEVDVMDTASLHLEFPGGVVATLEADRFASYGYDQRIEIFGTGGMAQVGNPPQSSTFLANSAGLHSSRLKHSFPERFFAAYRVEIDAFLKTLVGEMEPPVKRSDVLYSSLVAEAGRLSAITGDVLSPRLDETTKELSLYTAQGDHVLTAHRGGGRS